MFQWRDPLRSLGGEFVSQAILSSKMNGSVTGLAFSTSDDGVHGWRDVALSEEGPFDTQSVAMFDEMRKECEPPRYRWHLGCILQDASDVVVGRRRLYPRVHA